jgi:hypothetical protein
VKVGIKRNPISSRNRISSIDEIFTKFKGEQYKYLRQKFFLGILNSKIPPNSLLLKREI